jgi:hypothetical protein
MCPVLSAYDTSLVGRAIDLDASSTSESEDVADKGGANAAPVKPPFLDYVMEIAKNEPPLDLRTQAKALKKRERAAKAVDADDDTHLKFTTCLGLHGWAGLWALGFGFVTLAIAAIPPCGPIATSWP